jgi:hypothetical protein
MEIMNYVDMGSSPIIPNYPSLFDNQELPLSINTLFINYSPLVSNYTNQIEKCCHQIGYHKQYNYYFKDLIDCVLTFLVLI